jgi:hypothetical protein
MKLTSPSIAALEHCIHLADELLPRRRSGSLWEPTLPAVLALAKVIRNALIP